MITRLLTQEGASSSAKSHLQMSLGKKMGKTSKPDDICLEVERAVTFSPFHLARSLGPIFLDLQRDWCNPTAKKKKDFDPDYRVECELPTYLLQKVLPSEVLGSDVSPHTPPILKRKHHRDFDDSPERPHKSHRLVEANEAFSLQGYGDVLEPLGVRDKLEHQVPLSLSLQRIGVERPATTLQNNISDGNRGTTERPVPSLHDVDWQEELNVQRAMEMSLANAPASTDTLHKAKVAKTSSSCASRVPEVIDLSDL